MSVNAELRNARNAKARSKMMTVNPNKKVKKSDVVNPDAATFKAMVLVVQPQNKKDDQGNPTGNFTYNISLANNSAADMIGQPSQFHGENGRTHEYEEPSGEAADITIFGLPSFCNKETARDGCPDFTIPVPGTNGYIKAKCPTEVHSTPFLPMKFKGLSAKSFYMTETVQKKTKGGKDGKEETASNAAAAAAAADPDAPVVDAGNAAPAEEAAESTEFKTLYHMINVGSIEPYPELGGVIFFGEALQAAVKGGLVPRAWYEPDLGAVGAPENSKSGKMQTWNLDLRAIPMGPDMPKILKKMCPDENIPVSEFLDLSGGTNGVDTVVQKVMIDLKRKTEGLVTVWSFPVEINVDASTYKEDSRPPEQTMHYLRAKTDAVYAQFGIDTRADQRDRAKTVFGFVRNFMNGLMFVGRDWARTTAMNTSNERIDAMSFNPIGKKLDGMVTEDVQIKPHAWELMSIKGDFRRVVLTHGIEVSRLYAKNHYEIISKTADKAGRNQAAEDNVALNCCVEHGMMPISSNTSTVGDYIPHREGDVDIEESGEFKVRYFLLHPEMLDSRSAAVSTAIKACMNEGKVPKGGLNKAPQWGDNFAKMLSPNPVVVSKMAGCPKDLAKLAEGFEAKKYPSVTVDTLMLYAVVFSNTTHFLKIDADPLFARREALKILTNHYEFKPDFSHCGDKAEAVAASKAKKDKAKESKKVAKVDVEMEEDVVVPPPSKKRKEVAKVEKTEKLVKKSKKAEPEPETVVDEPMNSDAEGEADAEPEPAAPRTKKNKKNKKNRSTKESEYSNSDADAEADAEPEAEPESEPEAEADADANADADAEADKGDEEDGDDANMSEANEDSEAEAESE